jgi:hypothetical protein
MVGITALFAFIGILLGLITGVWWGFTQSWVMGITASAGGAVGGGALGWIVGYLSEEIPTRIHRFSESHRMAGRILFWSFWLLYLALIAVFAYAWLRFIRPMRGH